jgi:hypothetical protein
VEGNSERARGGSQAATIVGQFTFIVYISIQPPLHPPPSASHFFQYYLGVANRRPLESACPQMQARANSETYPSLLSRANESIWKGIKGRLNTGVKPCLISEHVVRDRWKFEQVNTK